MGNGARRRCGPGVTVPRRPGLDRPGTAGWGKVARRQKVTGGQEVTGCAVRLWGWGLENWDLFGWGGEIRGGLCPTYTRVRRGAGWGPVGRPVVARRLRHRPPAARTLPHPGRARQVGIGTVNRGECAAAARLANRSKRANRSNRSRELLERSINYRSRLATRNNAIPPASPQPLTPQHHTRIQSRRFRPLRRNILTPRHFPTPRHILTPRTILTIATFPLDLP